jgi:hypothetical protein
MDVQRRGSERDHGISSTSIEPRTIAWKPATKSVEITSWFVPDFNTPARHDWYVSVTLDELRQMLDAAASALGGTDSKAVAEALAPCLTSMLRLATECSLVDAKNDAAQS